MKIFAISSPSHDWFKDNIFLPSLTAVGECDVCVENCPTEHNGDYGTDLFIEAMLWKIRRLGQWMASRDEGEVVLCSDVDIRYFRPFAAAMVAELGDCEMAFQRENEWGGSANLGQIVIRVNDRTLEFIQHLWDRMSNDRKTDQDAINLMLNNDFMGLKWRLLSNLFANTATGPRADMYSYHTTETGPKDGMTSVEQKKLMFEKLKV